MVQYGVYASVILSVTHTAEAVTMSKKETKKKETKKKRQKTNADFFQADWNDDVYVQRQLSKGGRIGGRKLG